MEIGVGIVSFTGIVLVLGLFVLLARNMFVPSGECEVSINDRLTVTAVVGCRLLDVLAEAEVRLPSACGGAGTCGLCKLRVLEGGGEAGPQELAHMTRLQALQGTHLACQVPVLAPMAVQVDAAYFGVRTWTCRVESTRNVSTLIREIVLRLPEGEEMDFRAGGFVQITCPPFQVKFADFDIGDAFRDVWDKGKLWRLEAAARQPETRAYSMANHPGEKHRIILDVRIALPPTYAKNVSPGVVSSWLFSCKAGDSVEVTGPFGHFFVEDTNKEAVFIGGGVGMAPLRAQILDLLELRHSKRTISFWYGGRSRRELFYSDVFERLSGAPVVDGRGRLVGVLSKKDCFEVIYSSSYHQEWGGRVEEYMTREVTTIESGTDIIKAADLFMSSGFRRFPILENGRMTGQISRADLLRALEEHWANVGPTSR